MAVRDRLAINGKADRARHFAMPCTTKTREDSSFDPNIEPTIKWIVREDKDLHPDGEPHRRKPRFNDNIFVEEAVVDYIVDNYIYVISRVRQKP
eukprot:12107014-Heterocapsa_arctica.AAC.1